MVFQGMKRLKNSNLPLICYNTNVVMRKTLVFGFLVLFFSFPSLAFAGGGPVSLMAFPLRPFDNTKSYILQVDMYADSPCSELKPQVNFQESIDGDSITPFTPADDGTYFTQHYNTGQPLFAWKQVCTYYFQAKSGTAKQRIAVVKITVDGIQEERTTPVAYGDDSWSKQLQSFGRVNDYDNTPQVGVINEKPYGEFKRELSLQWQKIPWATKYTVFMKELESNGTVTPPASLETTTDTHVNVILPKDSNIYLSVLACKGDDPCSQSKENMYDYLIERVHTANSASQTMNPQEVAKTLPPVVTPSSSPHNDKVDELNKKVAALEGKLEESNKKQNVLEEKLTQLLNFIRSLFPNF